MTKKELMSKMLNLTVDDFITQAAYDKSFRDAFGVTPNIPFVTILGMGLDELDDAIPTCFAVLKETCNRDEQSVELANLLWSVLSLDTTLKERCTLNEEARLKHASALCMTSDHFLGHEVTRKALKIIKMI
jgi:hypothetical protein